MHIEKGLQICYTIGEERKVQSNDKLNPIFRTEANETAERPEPVENAAAIRMI